MAVIDRDRWRVLEPLLDEALDLSAEEQAPWLEKLRTSSPELAAELGSLLSSEKAADRRGFLLQQIERPLEGLHLGAYTLERPLGHGGMGSVWLARRTDGRFEGRAAVKLLNLSLLSAAGQERFRREGSTLARLAHAGIARLLDAGVSPSGQPYLVLEHVDGRQIDAFARDRGLSREHRIRLVLQVLDAVSHAHANLVVHRDIKPSNILVTDDGSVKLLDFGIAKLLDAEGTGERTAVTIEAGRAFTPEFTSPEQVRGDTVTTATDVYAVGVLLYLLLSGRHPTAEGCRTPADAVRTLLDVEPARLGLGDLDNILARALRKAPAERYQTVAAFADDLVRYLRNEPVSARRDSLGYRARKFVGRHRGGVAIAAAGVVLLAGGVVRERTLRARAEAEAQKARAVEEYLVGVFDVANPLAPGSQRGDVTARALLDRGAARVDSALADQPEVQAELRGVLGRVYVNLGLYDDAAPLLRRSLEQRRSLHGPRHPAVAEAMHWLGDVLTRQNRFDEAEPLLREALAQRRALFGSADTATAASLDRLAALLKERGDYDEAEPLFREALAIRRALPRADEVEVANSLNNLALLLSTKGEYVEAEPLFREALAIRERQFGADHPVTAVSLQNLAQLLHRSGRYKEADSLYRRAIAAKRKTLGNAHPSVTVSLNNLAAMLAQDLGRVEEAEALAREALALDRQTFGERHSYVAAGLQNLGTVLRLKGELDEAERTYRQALDIDRSVLGPEHRYVAHHISSIGTVLYLEGDLDGAIPLMREALAQYGRLLGEKHDNYTTVSSNLARASRERGRVAGVEGWDRAVSSRLDTTNRAQRGLFIGAQVGLGRTLTDRGRAAEALLVLERALEMSRSQYEAGDWRTGEPRLALGACLTAMGEYARSEPLLLEAHAVLQAHRRAQPRLARQARAALERLYQALGRPDEARRYRPIRGRAGS